MSKLNREVENSIKTVDIIPSKSDAHRAIICGALAGGYCEIVCDGTSEDIEATRDCMAALINEREREEGIDLYCRESGSTFRFLIPVVGALGKKGVFHPMGRLSERPLSPLYEELISHGLKLSPQGEVPFTVQGKLQPGEYKIPGDISSQFISGLLFALPMLDGDSRIYVMGELQSSGYVDMTISTISRFGVTINVTENLAEISDNEEPSLVYEIPGNQKYVAPKEYIVEGDWSNGAFWIAAGLIGDLPIKVRGLNKNSAQGDKAIVDVVREFGGLIDQGEDYVIAHPSKDRLKGITYDARQTPDMIPVVSLIASRAKGETKITNAERLRIKESDRLHSICETLKNLGGDIEETGVGLMITGVPELKGGTVDSFNDHRIAMMAAISSLVSNNKVKILRSEAAAKSYPGFYIEMKKLNLDGNLEI